MDPGTAMLIASAVAAAAKGTGDYFSSQGSEKAVKKRAKELKRETQAGMLQNALDRSSELEEGRLQGRSKLGKRRATSLQDTASLIRGALNI